MKRSRRHQKGYVFRKGNFWYLRYRQPELQKDGASVLVQKCRKLVECAGAYRSKKSVRTLADEFLEPFNSRMITPQSSNDAQGVRRDAISAVC